MYKYENVNQALIGVSQLLVAEGVVNNRRGMEVVEIPYPVMIEISNPTDRYATIPNRKWNKYLGFVESLWIALGMNDLDKLPGHYVKNLYKYSDDGRTWRAGYGPRLRCYNGLDADYDVSHPDHRHIFVGKSVVVDQLKYVIESLRRDINTRQAIITLGDPAKDSFDIGLGDSLKTTKDYPCSRSLQFMVVGGKLDLTLYMRSNDIVFGMSGVNVFNFTFMLEYIANILGVPVGKYYHISNNLHAYVEFMDKVCSFAKLELIDFNSPYRFVYADRIRSLVIFDELLNKLYDYERKVRFGVINDQPSFGNDMFDDWGKVFLHHANKNMQLEFVNPYLNRLF